MNQTLQDNTNDWLSHVAEQMQQRVVLYGALLIVSLALLLAYFNYASHHSNLDWAPSWSNQESGYEIAGEQPRQPCPAPPPWLV
jgi:hypothetical protein